VSSQSFFDIQISTVIVALGAINACHSVVVDDTTATSSIGFDLPDYTRHFALNQECQTHLGSAPEIAYKQREPGHERARSSLTLSRGKKK
jgi:hypothetical protein